MNRVLDRLWIGDARDIDAGVPLRALGFSAVVDLRDGVDPRKLFVPVHRLGNRDGDPWTPGDVERVYDFVAEHIRRGRVLVACAAGISRSASVVIGFLVSRGGWDAVSAHEAVRRVRPKIAPVETMLAAALGVDTPKKVAPAHKKVVG